LGAGCCVFLRSKAAKEYIRIVLCVTFNKLVIVRAVKSQYLKDKIDELATNSKNKNIRDL
jgi:hypothetical protein